MVLIDLGRCDGFRPGAAWQSEILTHAATVQVLKGSKMDRRISFERLRSGCLHVYLMISKALGSRQYSTCRLASGLYHATVSRPHIDERR